MDKKKVKIGSPTMRKKKNRETKKRRASKKILRKAMKKQKKKKEMEWECLSILRGAKWGFNLRKTQQMPKVKKKIEFHVFWCV